MPNILSCLNSQIDDKDYKLGMAVLLGLLVMSLENVSQLTGSAIFPQS